MKRKDNDSVRVVVVENKVDLSIAKVLKACSKSGFSLWKMSSFF